MVLEYMMWWIIAVVVGAALFDGKDHEFSSNRHFQTEAECVAYIPTDVEELEIELMPIGLQMPYRIVSRCEIDSTGEPA